MSTFSEQISSSKAVLRFDVIGGPERTAVAEDMSFLNYRLGSVEVSHEITMPIVDTDERRQDRAAFCAKYAAGRPYYMIRAKAPSWLSTRSTS